MPPENAAKIAESAESATEQTPEYLFLCLFESYAEIRNAAANTAAEKQRHKMKAAS